MNGNTCSDSPLLTLGDKGSQAGNHHKEMNVILLVMYRAWEMCRVLRVLMRALKWRIRP